MVGISGLVSAGLLAIQFLAAPVAATSDVQVQKRDSNWWFANIDRQGSIPFGGAADYKIFRNVADYGAKGDGTTDDTAAINSAITDGSRCGKGCDSQTTTPAIVYFPPGTYLVSAPIIPYYYTHLVGDLDTIPTIKADAGFKGIGVIDSDPYDDTGNNWWTNQNNFFRQVRNFKIDLTGMGDAGTGIHWQVAQATSLQNIEFNMNPKSATNKQQGVFMDNGSGGFMTDLTFNGGLYGMFLGNQQFTTKNLTFNGVSTALYMNWNWLWTFSGVSITDADVGLDLTAGGSAQTTGQVIMLDSKIAATTGVLTLYDTSQTYTNGTLILDNVDFTGTQDAVKDQGSGTVVLPGGGVSSYTQGRVYTADGGKAVAAASTAPTRPAALTDGNGNFGTRSKPQYDGVAATNFVSVKAKGAKGDGSTDDTAALQAVFDGLSDGQIVYFDHGAYIISSTLKVPAGAKIVGEIWPMIVASGDAFSDQTKPTPMFQVGQSGDSGDVEISDIIFETAGAQPGAILVEWNLAGSAPGSSGMWDTHFRIGGTTGSGLQSDTCAKTPDSTTTADPKCIGSFMLLHVTPSATIYLENVWGWVADHELDLADHGQINIYNGRGFLIESTKGAWLWGTAAEHSQLVNYNIANAQNVFMGAIQTETAYMQGNPDANTPFTSNPDYSDPDFSGCSDDTCARTWGLRVENSSDIFVYGGGLYSFFNNYAQDCLDTANCQDNMIGIDKSTTTLFGIATKASVNIITQDGKGVALDADNRNVFCAAIAGYTSSA